MLIYYVDLKHIRNIGTDYWMHDYISYNLTKPKSTMISYPMGLVIKGIRKIENMALVNNTSHYRLTPAHSVTCRQYD